MNELSFVTGDRTFGAFNATELNRQDFERQLRNLPVSINNLADPAILRDSTEHKLNTLVTDGHTGPVAIITKGNLDTPWWRERLPIWASKLNLFVFASVSELPEEFEPMSRRHRYDTMRAAADAGANVIAYVRPIIHKVNDDLETLQYIFRRSIESGAHAIVSSGFRGDERIVEEAGLKDIPAPDGQHWMKTLKLTSQGTSENMRELAATYGIPYWTRTMCAVAALRGESRSLSPYHLAPKFVGCDKCTLQTTCADSAQFQTPLEGSLELLRYLGYRVEVHSASTRYQHCDVEVRSQCILCCTNCPVAPDNLGVPYVNIRRFDGSMPSWGDMSFARFLTGGMLCTDPKIPPGENSQVSLHPRFSLTDGSGGQGSLYAVNSWMVWSEYLPQSECFGCSYCFLKMFEDTLPQELQVTVGMSPVRLLQLENRELPDLSVERISLPLVN